MNFFDNFRSDSFRVKCKLCLEVLEDYEQQNDLNIDLERKIFEIFPTNLFSFGSLSNLLCDSCFSSLHNFSSFRRRIIEQHDRLKSELLPFIAVDVKIKIEEPEFTETVFVKQERLDAFEILPDNKSESNPKSSKAETRNVTKKRRKKVSGRFRRSKKKPPGPRRTCYRCDCCDLRFRFKHQLRRHIETGIIQRARARRKLIKKTACAYCGIVLANSYLPQHVANIHEGTKRFQCDHCDYRTNTKMILNRHMIRHVPKQFRNLNYQCPDRSCDKSFVSKDDVRKHQLLFHLERKLVFCFCGKSYKGQKFLKYHMNTAHIRNERICNQCGKVFYDNRDLNYHIKTVHTT